MADMSSTETKRNIPKHRQICFALSTSGTRPKQPKQLLIGGGDFNSPLARTFHRGSFSAPLALRYGGPLHLERTP